MRIVSWLLGLENVTSIDQIDPSLAAPWASDEYGPFWVCLGSAVLIALALVFYLRFQNKGSRKVRGMLGACRGLLLALLFLTLADPVLRLGLTNVQNPLVYLVFDGTESMLIEDHWSEEQRTALESAVGSVVVGGGESTSNRGGSDSTSSGGDDAGAPANKESTQGDSAKRASGKLATRLDYVRALVGRADDNGWLKKLENERKVQIQPFVFDGNASSQLRRLTPAAKGTAIDPQHVAKQLTAEGQVTALGALLDDIPQQLGSGNLAAVVIVSDFAHNSGPAPLGSSQTSPAAKLGVPIFTVGVGATQAVDLAVDLQTDPKMKKAERTNVLVKLKQSGLEGQRVNVSLSARRLAGELGSGGESEMVIGQRQVALGAAESLTIDFPFTPEESGRFEFSASVDPLDGEIVSDNNRAVREVNIIDDYLRLMYVAYEPTWEWRFIKEVFHRDKLVGVQGFRTFLSSSDPRVRESNVLFLPSLTPKRSEFFATDVLFLDDMPQTGLSPRFCDMVKEFVGELGGGLVVIAGPRFGPRELIGTSLADMLPVTLDTNARLRQDRDFELKLTRDAEQYSFMRLDENASENTKAWKNLGPLSWYQPVMALNKKATALAVHPTEKCADGETQQPLIAVGRYGKGEVVYVGFNETWRLRRRYGEKYYRQFWSQLIYRVGMSHALGDSKRFVPRLDRQQYRAEEAVTFTVEAYDENYEPLSDDRLSGQSLVAELTIPTAGGGAPQVRELVVPMLRQGLFEARFPVFTPGEYFLRVKDPVTDRYEERRFEVTTVSAERSRAVRDEQLQRDLASRTRGQSYDLTTAMRLVSDLQVEPRVETVSRNHALWTTPLWFMAVVALMLGEWFARKMVRLS